VLSRWKYQRATRFLAVSNFVSGRLLAAGIGRERIAVIHDGIETKNRPISSTRRPVVVAPATDDPEKGSALASAACRSAGVELQFSAALEDDLPHVSVFLYLTHSEGLGSAILLSMACGTPVIASNVGGIPEVVEHGKTGLLVENTPEAVKSAIEEVFRDPAAASCRAIAARDQVMTRFSDVIMVAQTEREYKIAVGKRP
jgi:starch synthase